MNPADEMFELLNPVPEVVAKVFPGARVVPMTSEEIKEYTKKQ